MRRSFFALGLVIAVAGCGSSSADSTLQSGGGGGGGAGATTSSSSGGTSTSSSGGGPAPTLGGCQIFPADNPWNTDVSGAPLHAQSDAYIAQMAPAKGMHPDWGKLSDGYGIPFASGTGVTAQSIMWTASWGPTESDKVPCAGGDFCYPIPLTAPIEGGTGADPGSDRHVLYIDTAGGPTNCTLYELYNAQNPMGSWVAANGAVFHLGSNALRTDGWTSADAAGLPILPGLVRVEEVVAGEIRHAMRFTMNNSTQAYIHPATHAAGKADPALPPMGLRLRLKASFDVSSFTGPTLVVLTALKKYGLILADNGSDWYVSGESNEGWDPYMDNLVSSMSKIHGSDFEVVDTGPLSTNGL
jgi:hypothetical protein